MYLLNERIVAASAALGDIGGIDMTYDCLIAEAQDRGVSSLEGLLDIDLEAVVRSAVDRLWPLRSCEQDEDEDEDDGHTLILRRFEQYGIALRDAGALLYDQGWAWCKSVLETCDKKRERDGGDPTIASCWCKKFSRDPDSFDVPEADDADD